jgi:putative DNA primase/helicase
MTTKSLKSVQVADPLLLAERVKLRETYRVTQPDTMPPTEAKAKAKAEAEAETETEAEAEAGVETETEAEAGVETGVETETEKAKPTRKATKKNVSPDTPFADIEPWHEPINPAALLTEISATIKRFIVCSNETASAAALWIAMTWFMDVVQVAPLAVITAPEKRCGKTQLLTVLGHLVCKPLTASNITSAALFRSIDAWQPTLLIDEADAFMRENEELRGLINCGHTRNSAYIVRTVGTDFTPKQFNVWGAKAISGIGHLADTLMDRAIVLPLRRKLPTESVARLRYAEPKSWESLSRKLARFAQDFADEVGRARPDLPDELNDRAQDNWEPLLQIADTAGGDWPKRARIAAIALSSDGEQSQTIGVELLSDIHAIFEAKNVDRLSSADLVAALVEDEEKRWAGHNRGFPIKPAQVARLLREYNICSNTIRVFCTTKKGYLRNQFEDAFARYVLADPLPADLPVTPSQANADAGLAVTPVLPVTDAKVTGNTEVTRNTSIHAGCDGVTANSRKTAGSIVEVLI